MNVVLGAYLLSSTPGYRQAGVHRYAQQLLKALAGLRDLRGLRLSVLVSPTVRDELSAALEGLRASGLSESASEAGPGRISIRSAGRTTEQPFSRIVVEQVETPRALRALKADLYHGLGFVAPLRAPCPTVVTVFDLSFITQPRSHKLLNRIYLSLFTRWSCRRAARVVAISAWTRYDVTRHFGIALDRVDAIPLGVDHDHFKPLPPDEVAVFKAQHGIGEGAIFYLGSLEPRKNLTRLVEAFQLLRRTLPDAQLFVGGSPAWHYGALLRSVEANAAGNVHLIGRVDEAELPKWYSACAVMAYPSLYEGFGLPPLEAMACGAPVVTSNVTSLPEVVGDAGVTVDPTNVPAMAEALARVLRDGAFRAELRTKALARAACFTWERTAEQTVQSYLKALRRPTAYGAPNPV